ncbi:MAG: type III pantothenate kinase, partial [Gammaproteobacteria bacterium]|nr:type III pantothenate kinase [Gammaproteobacteria bacterium]
MSKPYLLVDCGNSRSKWALLDSTGLGAVSYVDNSAAPDQIIEKLPSAESLDKVYLAAVSSSQIPNQISSHFNRLPISLLRVKNPYLGLGLAYKSIDQLGVDRWLAMLWAWLNYQQSCLVVNIGTAMTIDAINDAGEHLGGVITPGPRLQFQSLHQHTHAIDLQT